MKVKCPICKKEIEKTDDHVQRCPYCTFYFDPAVDVVEEWKEVNEEAKTIIRTKLVADIVPDPPSKIRYTFCFTGRLDRMSRNEVKDFLSLHGHYFKNIMTYGVDYLVTNTPNSGTEKNVKAKRMGVPIIDEKEFFKLLEVNS